MTGLDRVRELVISDTGFVFDPTSGATFTVNGSGKFILEALRAGRTQAQIATMLNEKFSGTSTRDFEDDILDFLRVLQACGLLSDTDALRQDQR